MGIKLGNLDISSFKVGGADCSIYLGNTKLYPTPSYDNIITYEASAKLDETTSASSSWGLHTNSFSGASGQLTMTSHTFENGVGTVEFDDDVISIGDYAFYHCDSLTSIDIPDIVTSIGERAFAFCSSLTSIDIPDSVTSIGGSMIDGSGIQTITIGSGITYIGSCGLCCSNLTNGVTIKAVNPPTIPNCNWIFSVQSSIYVPAESVTAYQNDQCWSAYAQGIQPIP
jgi:hypothetical protein